MTRLKLIQAIATLTLAGAAIDFLVNGVLKILWISIYGTVYLGIAVTLYNYAHSNRWRPYAWLLALAFLMGATFGHLILTGRIQLRVYPMTLVTDSPISLQSPEFSDFLYIISDPLQKKLAQGLSPANIPVAVQVIKNYGCIESFKVTTVAGVDVMSDPKAHWVWKPAVGVRNPIQGLSGMEVENRRLFWCRIHWF